MVNPERKKKLLHVGCGPKTRFQSTKIFGNDDWEETRLDIDSAIDPTPDIIGSMVDLSMIEDGVYDAVYSSHNIEHLFPHEVEPALAEFYRVLNNEGEVFIACPDLQGVAKHVAEGNLLGKLYDSPAGPIAAIDILYGHRAAIQQGKHYMAHKCGFTVEVLVGLLSNKGFLSCAGASDGINMWVNCIKTKDKAEEIKKRLSDHLGSEVQLRDKN